MIDFRHNCAELSKDELDLIIKASLCNFRQSGDTTSSCKHKTTERIKPSQQYYFKGKRICRSTFCFIHAIDKQKLQVIGRSLDNDGLKPRVHGLAGRKPPNSLTVHEQTYIYSFLKQYATDNALPLPGRLPNFKHAQVLLLPSDKRQADIHEIYVKAASETAIRSASLSTFIRTWKDLCPNIVLSKPSTDLCHQCQMLSFKISNSGSLNEEEKNFVIEKYNNHIRLAKEHRDKYRSECLAAKDALSNSTFCEGSTACSYQGTVHYSWDYAQQVHIPHHSHEVGPLFFKTPRKCEVFGVCCEGTGKQTFYLVDESESVGKGANSVVSMVHHYLNYYGVGETDAQFHFDNCSGQNKNNIVLWYALWRVIVGLHKTVKYGQMIAGHTKFEPDWHFGIWKSKWRHCNAETIQDVASTVTLSSKAGHNVPQLVKDIEKPVIFYNWKEFLSKFFKPLKNITKYHLFFVSADEPGVVVCKKNSENETEKYNLLNCSKPIDPSEIPEELAIKGIDLPRQWYLYSQIRDFCFNEEAKNVTCPKPCVCTASAAVDLNESAARIKKRKI